MYKVSLNLALTFEAFKALEMSIPGVMTVATPKEKQQQQQKVPGLDSVTTIGSTAHQLEIKYYYSNSETLLLI